MMAPKFERLRDIETVLSEAALVLDHPIDRIEVIFGGMRVSAGPQTVDVELDRRQSVDAEGLAMPGTPARSCRFGPIRTKPGLLARIRRLLAR